MILIDNIKQAEGLGGFFKNLGKKGLNVSKKMAKNASKKPSRALDITANFATAAASRNLKNVMSTPLDLLTFYNTGKGLNLGKFVWFFHLNRPKMWSIISQWTIRKFWIRTKTRKEIKWCK